MKPLLVVLQAQVESFWRGQRGGEKREGGCATRCRGKCVALPPGVGSMRLCAAFEEEGFERMPSACVSLVGVRGEGNHFLTPHTVSSRYDLLRDRLLWPLRSAYLRRGHERILGNRLVKRSLEKHNIQGC